jgi:opacity protein-like surface antigen
VAVIVAVATAPLAQAEDIVGRWRVEVHVGALDPGDSIISEAGNLMTLVTEDASRLEVNDPRSNIQGNLALQEAQINADPRIDLRAGYGFAAWKNTELYIDFGIAYYEQSIDNIELAYSLDVQDPDYVGGGLLIGNTSTFNRDGARFFEEQWQAELIHGGQLETYPVSINALARFRPTKRLNPYIGAGLGYYFVEFTPSTRWMEVADALDATCVTYVGFRDPDLPSLGGRDVQVDADVSPDPGDGSNPCRLPAPWSGAQWDGQYLNFGHDTKRPKIEAPNTIFLEARAGVEWQWKPRIALFTDLRFTWAADEVTITADGRQKFGRGVPAGTFAVENPPAPRGGEPAYISFYPGREEDLAVGEVKTGVGSPGEYMLNGGVLDYGGWHFSAGIRFTL